MTISIRRILLYVFFGCLFLSGCTQPPAENAVPVPSVLSIESLTLPDPVRKDLDSVPVYVDGLLSDRAYRINDDVYLSPSLLSSLAETSCKTSILTDSVLLQFPTLTVMWEKDAEILLAGSRYLYAPGGCQLIDDQLYLPSEALSHLFSVSVVFSDSEDRVSISTAGLHLMADSSPDYYERVFSTDDIYWLSRIISAEAETEPLAGQIGVGNVVLNRVADPRFPHTVLDVILEHDNSIQFDSAAEGKVTYNPSDRSVIAAYLCMEGYNTVNDSLYYVNPSVVNADWFRNNLRLVCVIENHEFYGEVIP